MISFATDIIKPVNNFREELDKAIALATGNAMSAYIEAAADAVPVWTGYTRAIWEGVAVRVAELLPVTIEPKIDLSGARNWYSPNRAVGGPSSSQIADLATQQQAKGYEDGYKAVSISKGVNGILVHVAIPEYEGEQNYAIRESAWRSLAAGEIAYQFAYDQYTENLLDRVITDYRINFNG